MKNIPIKYSPTDASIKELAQKYQNLEIIDAKSYKACTQGIAEVRTLRTSVETRRKELKADSLAWGKKVDTEAKRITALLLPIEDNLKNLKQATDDKKALIKAEKDRLEQERVETIKTKIAAFPPDMSKLPQLLKMTAPEIREMQDALATIEIDLDVYQEFTPEAIKTKADKTKLVQEYYIARIQSDAEEKKQQAETERQEQARIKQVAEQKIEDDRLAKIREEQEAEAQRMRDDQAEIDAQRKAIQDEKDRIDQEKTEQIRLEQEKQAQIERNKIAKIEAKEQERARIEAVAADKKRQEEMRPDKENLLVYLDTLSENINSTVDPVIKTSEGKAALSFVQTSIEKVFVDTLEIIGEM